MPRPKPHSAKKETASKKPPGKPAEASAPDVAAADFAVPEKEEPKVRLLDLARIACVSTMTVSLALRNSPRISLAQRERIQKIAAAAGYRRDSRMNRLMEIVRSHKTRHGYQGLALVHDLDNASDLEFNPWSVATYEGAKARSLELGYRLNAFWLKEPGMTAAKMNRLLAARGVEALLVIHQRRAAHSSIKLERFAAATIGYNLYRPNLHRACTNVMQGLLLAARQLRNRGYRRIGLVTTPWINGLAGYTYSAGIHLYNESIHSSERVTPLHLPENPANGKKSFCAWVNKCHPDVIIGHELLPDWLRSDLGLRIPEDIGFVQHDWISAYPQYAGLDHRKGEVATAAVDLIDEQLRHGHYGIPTIPRMILIPPVWVEGPSIRAPRASSSKRAIAG